MGEVNVDGSSSIERGRLGTALHKQQKGGYGTYNRRVSRAM